MRKWTEEQDAVIAAEVAANPDHMRDAFRKAADKIGRTPDACVNRFYNTINKQLQHESSTVNQANPKDA
jgi:hypothetical protein